VSLGNATRPSRPDAAIGARDERGLTLIEVVVVGVLAAIVMVALTGFYISSQGTWIDASSQAVTQREASLALATIADSVRASNSAIVLAGTKTLILLDSAGNEKCRFWFHPGDSLLHLGKGTSVDWGPIGTSKVTAFDLASTATRVNVLALEMRTASGRHVRMSTLAAFYNR